MDKEYPPLTKITAVGSILYKGGKKVVVYSGKRV